jgi:hypothetical protein
MGELKDSDHCLALKAGLAIKNPPKKTHPKNPPKKTHHKKS